MAGKPFPFEKLVENFHKGVKRGDPEECWPWTRGRGTYKGKPHYGSAAFIFNGKKRSYRTHVIAHYLEYGINDSGLQVLHKCNNKICCNPNHLYLGTHKDNMRDMHNAGTQFGENTSRAKLTNTQVLEIRKRYMDGETQVVLCQTFNMTQGSLAMLIRGERWGHLPFPSKKEILERKYTTRSRQFSEEQIKEIRKRCQEIPQKEVCFLFGTDSSTISRIVNRKLYNHIP